MSPFVLNEWQPPVLWIKALHISFMVTWFAGLFYLPRLFVYHAMSDDAISIERFKIMERKLFFGIMTPGAILTIVFGVWLLWRYGAAYHGMPWLHAKMFLVLLLIAYHLFCGKLLRDFKQDRNRYHHVFYRLLNEAPVLALFGIVMLVVVKPASPVVVMLILFFTVLVPALIMIPIAAKRRLLK